MGRLLVPASVGAHRHVQDDVRTIPVPAAMCGGVRMAQASFAMSGMYVPGVGFRVFWDICARSLFQFCCFGFGIYVPGDLFWGVRCSKYMCSNKLICVISTFILPALPRAFAELSDPPAGLPYLSIAVGVHRVFNFCYCQSVSIDYGALSCCLCV